MTQLAIYRLLAAAARKLFKVCAFEFPPACAVIHLLTWLRFFIKAGENACEITVRSAAQFSVQKQQLATHFRESR